MILWQDVLEAQQKAESLKSAYDRECVPLVPQQIRFQIEQLQEELSKLQRLLLELYPCEAHKHGISHDIPF